MHKVKVVIIEDEFFVAHHLEDLVESFGFKVASIYHSGEDFLKETDWDFDIALVDIFLSKDMSGLDIAPHLNAHQKRFIFLTANQDSRTLKEAASLHPMAYITKPFKPNDIFASLQIIANQLPKNIKIRKSNSTAELSPSDILFIKSDGVYIEIHTKKEKIIQRKLLKEILEELPSNFARVHRSFVINEHYIEEQSYSTIKINGVEIPISRNYKKD